MSNYKIKDRQLSEDFVLPVEKGGRVNPNLLHNWYFGNPVNRNGLTEYMGTTEGGTWIIDRWRVRNGKSNVTVADGVLKIENTSQYSTYFEQLLTNPTKGTHIVSVLVKSISGQCYVQPFYTDGTRHAPIALNEGLTSVVLDPSKEVERVFMQVNPGGTVEFIAVKLELGDTQTLAHQENGVWVLNEIPDYAEQMAICMQYDKTTGAYTGITASGVGALSDTVQAVDIGARPNANLLHNWYFVNPVNRNGLTEYPVVTTSSVPIDRWRVRNSQGRVIVEEDGLRIINDGTTYSIYFEQFIDETIPINTYCLSVLASEITGTIYCQVLYADGKLGTAVSLSNGITQIAQESNKNIKKILFQVNTGRSVKLKAVKLERGKQQTLAHQDANGNWVLNEIPDYAEQMAICSQYDSKTDAYLGLTPEAIRKSVNYIGVNPINTPEDDTVANWVAFGSGWAYINGFGKLNNQPAQWGFVENIVSNDGLCYQVWHSMTTGGTIFHRGGANNNGWYDNGSWQDVFDEKNINTLVSKIKTVSDTDITAGSTALGANMSYLVYE